MKQLKVNNPIYCVDDIKDIEEDGITRGDKDKDSPAERAGAGLLMIELVLFCTGNLSNL